MTQPNYKQWDKLKEISTEEKINILWDIYMEEMKKDLDFAIDNIGKQKKALYEPVFKGKQYLPLKSGILSGGTS